MAVGYFFSSARLACISLAWSGRFQTQRRKLQKRARQAAGLKEFLADVDMEQIAKQVEVLTSVKNGIAQHRATLSA
ncbi:hypothetical protein LJY25_13110 [Hymenobacter sp. BT175]|uniref:hypothetical protein n=1 Tax=Hymenobacter translucens TaxID=2886507 RepID=UPI001D0DF719|nr:hypothetical protein [Hymenobacter translucens]MCC2547388.1 hypothetical protein [Hymenobacter translucens]